MGIEPASQKVPLLIGDHRCPLRIPPPEFSLIFIQSTFRVAAPSKHGLAPRRLSMRSVWLIRPGIRPGGEDLRPAGNPVAASLTLLATGHDPASLRDETKFRHSLCGSSTVKHASKPLRIGLCFQEFRVEIGFASPPNGGIAREIHATQTAPT